ncbi:MAG: protease [Acidobacteria bacterium]|nr:MAG: protease [Acidobacteriota bacterium]
MSRTFFLSLFVAIAAVPAALSAAGSGEARLLRFADIHGDRVAFVYAGDIWVAPSEGGEARRLTSDPGLELFPKFSPDGRLIAFSAEYDGTRQVYVIPAEGGAPRQLTFYNDVGPLPPRGGFDYRVLDWTPDGEFVVVRANRLPWGVRMGRPYLVPVHGGMERPLPIPEGGGGMMSPDGKKFVYTPIDREFRTWKRYRGGRAQDVWIFDLETMKARQLTDYPGTDNQPLWVGDTIYFTSDREDGRLNLYAYDLTTGDVRKVTHHRDFDVLWPSAGPERIVYECGGYLYRFDPATGESTRIPIRLTGDFAGTLPRLRRVDRQIRSASLSPHGKRALFGARGEIFTVPAEHGPPRNLTRSPGVREISPAWSPDGKWVAYLSDRSGEYEIYIRPQDGSGPERRLTRDGDTWRFPPVWSPDSRKIAFADKRQRLRLLDVETGKITDVDRSTRADIRTYRWSPDSRYLVYTKLEASHFSSIYVYDVELKKVSRLTDEMTNDYDPVFDPEGRYLYFLSDRDYNLEFSGYEFNYIYTNPTRVYAASLSAAGPPPLPPLVDEEAAGEGKDSDGGDSDGGGEKAAALDVEGFSARVVALPGDPADYRQLHAAPEGPVYLVGKGRHAAVKLFSLAEREEKVLIEGVSSFDLSADGKKLLYRAGESFGVVDASPGRKVGDGRLDLSRMEALVDPRAEWREMFVDAWRILRDWFYDPGMHGLDWPALRDRYAPLVEHVAHRADLDYILGELGGELGAGHVYVNSGDMPRPERHDGGLLGAEIEAHPSGYFRIAHIFPGENWHEDFRSPLTMPGVDVHEGDFILAVDGRSTREVSNFYELLRHTAGRTVSLRVNSKPSEEGARTVLVVPIRRETNLRYLDWVRSRQRLVDELSGGRIGYIHLPNTAVEGNRQLRKLFYPQAHKDALIIDVRYNGGGFIPDRMIELLERTPLSFWARRGVEPMRTPEYAHSGPKVCLINGYSSSGGDAFPYYFRELGLGKLIGTRTWGGLIGLSGNPGLVDGGSVSVPTFRFMDPEGRWAVEGVGVEPDIEVVDRPDLVAAGRDPTLEKAVEVLLEELERHPPRRITPPEPPRSAR